MSKEYIIKNLGQKNGKVVAWEGVPSLHIDCYPWEENGYMPNVEAKIGYTNEGLHIYFKVFEEVIRATYLKMHDPVYKDSCVEFFFNPNPYGDKRYMNFEMNPLGTVLVGFGEVRSERVSIPERHLKSFNIRTSVNKENLAIYNGSYWTVEYTVPFEFIQEYYGKIDFESGYQFAGNFYKCGDDSDKPHFGCWNPILNAEPNFHLPQYFGALTLE